MDGDADAYRLAYEEAIRSLSQQKGIVESFHTRAGLLLSAAAITTSFLGAQVLESGRPGVPAWLALACFACLGGAVLKMLLPARDELLVDPKRIVADYIEIERPCSLAEIHRDLAIHIENSCADNDILLARLGTAFRLACGLMATEVVLWIVALALAV
jgi:hypothetical protein